MKLRLGDLYRNSEYRSQRCVSVCHGCCGTRLDSRVRNSRDLEYESSIFTSHSTHLTHLTHQRCRPALHIRPVVSCPLLYGRPRPIDRNHDAPYTSGSYPFRSTRQTSPSALLSLPFLPGQRQDMRLAAKPPALRAIRHVMLVSRTPPAVAAGSAVGLALPLRRLRRARAPRGRQRDGV